ncbi:MAG: tetratricopeptide repeat protein, partial [Parvularculaceae bacterium]
APAVRDETAAAANDLVRPRELYLKNITALKSAETDAQAKAALAEIEKAAALGHPPAQLQLGELYKMGQIYLKDLVSARAWFERAANGGNVLAMHRLGVMAARGEGGPVDPKLSISWFEKAASFGLLDSQYNLGATYHPTTERQADGVQNAGLAYFWYSVAAKNGDAQAAEMAAGLAQTLPPAERAARDAEAAAWRALPADPIANELLPAS